MLSTQKNNNELGKEKASVMKRRGKCLSNLDLKDSEDTNTLEICTPQIIEELLQFVVTPKENAQTKFNFSSCQYKPNGKNITSPTDISLGENSCALLTPMTLQNSDFSDYLNDITVEDIVQVTENSISDSFVSTLVSSKSSAKMTLFTPCSTDKLFSFNFFDNLNIPEDNITLVAPKAKEFITPQTPVVLKKSFDGQDEFNIYFPPDYTSNLVGAFQEYNSELAMFPFSCNEHTKKQNKYDVINRTQGLNKSAIYASSQVLDRKTKQAKRVKMRRRRSTKQKHVPECEKIKAFHNRLERKRREDQFARFQNLQCHIPSLAKKKKAAKISVLRGAISYIQELHREQQYLQNVKLIEKNRNSALLHMVYSFTQH